MLHYFLGLIHVSQHYLFKGDNGKNILYLRQAERIIEMGEKIDFNYKLFFYYHYAWSFFELCRYEEALHVVNKLLSLQSQMEDEPIILHASNIKCAILFSLKKYSECFKLANVVSIKSKKVFSNNNQDVYAESLLNVAKCLTQQNKYLSKAKNCAKRAISMLTTTFAGSAVDISQALANIVLGEVYEKIGDKAEALKYFKLAEKIYKNIYGGNVIKKIEYQNLMIKLEKNI